MAHNFALYAGQIAVTAAVDGITTAAGISTAGTILDKTCVQAPNGNLYFIDGFCIRKCDLAGRITTIAGSYNTSAYTDATGAAARFANPTGIAVDNAGNIYITENSNFTIRKITPDGTVTTWIGVNGSQNTTEGTGSAARMFGPRYLCYDGVNTLYVMDNFRIRIINVATATIGAFCGSNGLSGVTDGTGTNARFNFAAGNNGGAMWWQSARNVLVVMNPNNAITQFQVREINTGGTSSTPAMNNTMAFGSGIFGGNAGLNGLYGTSVGFTTLNGHFFTISLVGTSYTVVDENIWASHVGAGAALRSNVVGFGSNLAVFGREFSAGGQNGILLETSGAPVNGLAYNPSGGMNIDGTISDLLMITDLSGIYSLTPGLTHDIYLDRNPTIVQVPTKFPNPSFKSGYISG